MHGEYDVGDQVKITGRFLTGTNPLTPVDPSLVEASYRHAGDSPVSLVFGTDEELVKDSTGVYHFLIDLSSPGVWYFRMSGDGKVATEDSLTVKMSQAI